MKKIVKFILILLISYTFLFSQIVYANEKIKIGLLVPMSGPDKEIGQ